MKEKQIKMQYPYSEDAQLYDGKEHDIIPMKLMLVSFNNQKYYAMIYRDIKYNQELLTLLSINGNKLSNVPLDEEGYTLLGRFMIDHRYLEYDASEFRIKDNIGLTKPLDLSNYNKSR